MENLKKPKTENQWILKFFEFIDGLIRLLKNKYFYIGLVTVICGKQLNFFSQTYLHHYLQEGKTLPVLSDLILDNLPYWDIDYLYDIFMIVAFLVFIIYIIHKNEYKKVPYILLVSGLFQLVRGIFIVLTPFGHPSLFDGTETPFNAFSKYELGVYPSGHTGMAYLYFLLTQNKYYSIVLLFCVLIIITALFLARGHYSIDVLSGLFFAYAIKAFCDRYLQKYFYRESVK
ncbi:phosphatase PAP2 family protein [candidate division KSB1 bacterium]|nr:phosphatase PAP2 family protein [candidate division KSB1 bacterium]